MKIYKPRGITRGQIVLVTVLGVFSGVYIWRPLFDEYFPKKKKVVDANTENPASQ